jgi:predicted peptidase
MKNMPFPSLKGHLIAITVCSLGWVGTETAAWGANTADFQIFDYDIKDDGQPYRGDMPGRLYVPSNLNTNLSYPLVVFFCGHGEILTVKSTISSIVTNNGVVTTNYTYSTNFDAQINGNIDNLLTHAKKTNAPFYLYAPQAGGWGSYEPVEQTMVMVDRLQKLYKIDRNKIYVTGLSEGGRATRTAISHFRDIIAAAIPICPGSGQNESDFYADLANKPIWLFHATNDPGKNDPNQGVNVTSSRNFVNAIRTNAGKIAISQWPINAPATNFFYNDGLPYYTNYSALNGATYLSAASVSNFDSPELRYTEFNTNIHGIWGRVYNDNEILKNTTNAGVMYAWLLGKSLPAGLPAALTTNQTLLFDFGASRIDPAKDSLGRYWNGTIYGHEATTNTVLIPYAVATNGRRTPVQLWVTGKFGTWHKRGISNGAPYSDPGNHIAYDGWETVASTPQVTNSGIIRFKGLQAGSAYQMKIWASDTNSDGTYGRNTRYEITTPAAGTPAGTNLTVAYNTNGFVSLTALADASGQVDLKVYPQPGTTSRYGEISTLELKAVSAAPTVVAVNDTATTAENTVVDVNVLANDTGATTIQSSFPVAPGHGTVGVVNVGGVNKVRYTPAAGYSGADNFSYTIVNGTATATASVAMTITNVPPIAVADSVILNEGVVTNIDVLANDSGPNPLTIQSTFTVPPLHGTAAVVAGKVQYTPTPGYYGLDSFLYTVDDGNDTATATVSLDIKSTAIALNLEPDGLFGSNIGLSSAGSSRVLASGDWEINGSGNGVTTSADSFHGEMADVTGNFRVITRVKSLVGGGGGTRAGLMLREGTGDSARMVYLATTTGTAYKCGVRTVVGGSTAETTPAGSYAYANAWLKLERIGNTVILSTSADGATYTEVSTTTLSALASTVKAGLFSASDNQGLNARAVMAGFLLTETDVVFQQSFQSSTDYHAYYNAASPTERQFNDISADLNATTGNNGGTWSINASGQLQLVRGAFPSPDNGAGFMRYTNFATAPAVLCVRFKFGVSGLTVGGSQNDLMSLEIGNFTVWTDYNGGPSTAALFSKVNIDGAGSGLYKFEMNNTQQTLPAYSADGTMHTIAYFLNKSGVAQNYMPPGGVTTISLAANHVAFWVDENCLFDVTASNGSSSALTDLRLHFPFVDNGTWKFGNFSVENAF